MEIIQLTSAAVIFIASVIPIYFATKVRQNRRVLFSSALLTSVLVSYGFHAVIESLWKGNSGIVESCFITSIIGAIITYIIFQKKNHYSPIGGVFGVALLSVAGTWVAAESVRTFLPTFTLVAVYLVSSVMIGFGIFIFARFFWFRSLYRPLQQ